MIGSRLSSLGSGASGMAAPAGIQRTTHGMLTSRAAKSAACQGWTGAIGVAALLFIFYHD
jgi:hypothetical protein